MELRHLRYFTAVCEEMNISRAAEKLMIAQPPLSRQIKDLEEELGAPLFIREHHSLKLTEEGVKFRHYAQRILSLADRSLVDIREMHTGLHGTLYLAEVEGRGPQLTSGWISGFSRLYPDVQYSLWNGNSDEVTARIRDGLSDVAIIMGPIDPKGLHTLPLYSEPWIALFSKEHPLASCTEETVDLARIADYDLIIPSKDSRLREISDWFSPSGKEPKIRARISNMLNAYEMCRHNIGVAIFPASAADLIRGTEVETRIITSPSVNASYELIYSAEHPLSPVALRFIDYLKEQLLDS